MKTYLYYENAKALTVDRNDITGEEDTTLLVKDHRIRIFIPQFGGGRGFEPGETAKIRLELVGPPSVLSEVPQKIVQPLDNTVNARYLVCGPIVRIMPDPTNVGIAAYATIDCGFFIRVRILLKPKLKLGDYICADGSIYGYKKISDESRRFEKD